MKRDISPTSHRPAKKARTSADVAIVDDEDDLQAILAMIKEQEDSEALARKLQKGWDGVIDVDAEEDDEALAVRLSHEWTVQDNQQAMSSAGRQLQPLTMSATGCSPRRPSSYVSRDMESSPDQQLLGFRDLFTGERPCSKCHASMKPARGHVHTLLCLN
jgi:hypothetical protein